MSWTRKTIVTRHIFLEIFKIIDAPDVLGNLLNSCRVKF